MSKHPLQGTHDDAESALNCWRQKVKRDEALKAIQDILYHHTPGESAYIGAWVAMQLGSKAFEFIYWMERGMPLNERSPSTP